jgi:NDP-sugar pyrophosphorylase family protein
MTSHSAPQHAVILAAGLGSRLRPFTDDRPKPLVEVRGIPILHNALRNLAHAGVKETTIVVGYRREAIQRCCGESFAGMHIHYVESDVFDRTGSAYSLWLTREALQQGDTWLLEGDVFFEAALLTRMLRFEGDVAAVDVFDETICGSAALLTPEGGVLEFRMGQNAATALGKSLYKTVNIYRFTSDTLQRVIVPALVRVIDGGDRRGYVEQVLAQLLAIQALKLHGAVCRGVHWYEIDNEADLRRAEQIFNPSMHAELLDLVPSYQPA